jgi:hypothetical protein
MSGGAWRDSHPLLSPEGWGGGELKSREVGKGGGVRMGEAKLGKRGRRGRGPSDPTSPRGGMIGDCIIWAGGVED